LYCLNGIRFISMTWVILCHVYGQLGLYPSTNGLLFSEKVSDLSRNTTFRKIINFNTF
jgi:hypothetical protein